MVSREQEGYLVGQHGGSIDHVNHLVSIEHVKVRIVDKNQVHAQNFNDCDQHEI